MAAMGNEGVAGRIKQSLGAIGYVQYGYAARADLKMAALENKAGKFIAPTDESGRRRWTTRNSRRTSASSSPILKARIPTRS